MALIRPTSTLTRRRLLRRSALAGGGLLAGLLLPGRRLGQQTAPAVITSDKMRPAPPWGVQSGDCRPIAPSSGRRPTARRASRSSGRPPRASAGARQMQGPAALEDTDFTAKLDLAGLPPGQRIFYRVRFIDLADRKPRASRSPAASGPRPRPRRDVRFVWSGDTAGQGWGINPELGRHADLRGDAPGRAGLLHPLRRHDLRRRPDRRRGRAARRRHAGRTCTHRGEVTRSRRRSHEFRGNYAYNLMDEQPPRFNAEVPMLVQWDDHEVTNNWYPARTWRATEEGRLQRQERRPAGGARERRRSSNTCRSAQHPLERERIYAQLRATAPSLEVFRLDMRSYRGANTDEPPDRSTGRDARSSAREQMRWLKQALLASRRDLEGDRRRHADRPGRLRRLPQEAVRGGRQRRRAGAAAASWRSPTCSASSATTTIRNVVWLTADMHYTAAHYYDPNRAQFQEFAPFWEFVSGPLNAGTFGPNALDDTFGPEVVFAEGAARRARPTCRPRPACSSSARSTSTARARS